MNDHDSDVPEFPTDDVCPWAEELPAYLQGELEPERALDVSEHLDGCEPCRVERDELRMLLADLEEVDPTPVAATRDLADRVLSAIAQVVLTPFRQLGAGGMAWMGMAVASFLLILFIRGPLAPTDAPPPPARVAVADAASWLLEAQEPDGSWDPARWGGRDHWRVGLSGLALLAIVSSTPPDAGIDRHLDRAVAYLLREQAHDGRFGPASADHLYNHAPATLALLRIVERYPVTQLTAAVDRAVDYVAKCQSPSGGWGYADGPDAPNVVISGWPLEVLLAASRAGRRHDLDERITRARRWFSAMADDHGRYGYDRRGAFPHGAGTPTAVAVGLRPDRRWPAALDDSLDLIAVYFLARDTSDEALRARLRRRIASLQVRSGAHAGSFRPADRWASDGGRLYATALSVLAWNRL